MHYFLKNLLKHRAQHCCTVCPPLKHLVQRCAQQFWIVSEVELDPTSETVARNVSRNIGMGGHTLKHCVARDVSANVSGNVSPCVRALSHVVAMRQVPGLVSMPAYTFATTKIDRLNDRP